MSKPKDENQGFVAYPDLEQKLDEFLSSEYIKVASGLARLSRKFNEANTFLDSVESFYADASQILLNQLASCVVKSSETKKLKDKFEKDYLNPVLESIDGLKKILPLGDQAVRALLYEQTILALLEMRGVETREEPFGFY